MSAPTRTTHLSASQQTANDPIGQTSRRPIRHCLGAIGIAMMLSGAASAQVVFDVAFDASAGVLTGTERANLTSHLKEAGRRWLPVLDHVDTATISIMVSVADVPTANGGSNWSGFVGVIDGRNTWQPGAAFELRTGEDRNGAEHDVTIWVGLNYLRNELWFDPDPVARTAPVPVNRVDALSVMMHEIGHALVYNGWNDLTTGVPHPDYWSTFDVWFLPGAPTVFTGPAAVASWGTPPDLTTGNNKHWGNGSAIAAWQSGHRHAPAGWRADGSPIPQLGCGLMIGADAPPSADGLDAASDRGSPSLLDQLMNGVVYYRGRRYDISPLDRATLIDVGLRRDGIFANGFQH